MPGIQPPDWHVMCPDLEQVRALAAATIGKFGSFEIWVNNAGTSGPYGPTSGLTPEAFHTVIQTNIIGAYNGSKVAMNHFLPRKTGKLDQYPRARL